jgi:moderate conductance mechanosensitive channel
VGLIVWVFLSTLFGAYERQHNHLHMPGAEDDDAAPIQSRLGKVSRSSANIVSGIFFMTDDAFRVGEYIDTRRLKGTVEKITLRSVQLRHQNGQIHTVPFGQLSAITNFSRDWATVKFNIRIEHGTDLEKVRKVIKKVGRQMLEDQEIGSEFILMKRVYTALREVGIDFASNTVTVRASSPDLATQAASARPNTL